MWESAVLSVYLQFHLQKTGVMKDSVICCSDFTLPGHVHFKSEFQAPVPQSYSRPKNPPNFCINLLNNNNSIMCSLHTQWSASSEELTKRKPKAPILKLEWPSSLSSCTDTPGHIIRTLSTFLKRVSLDLFVFLWFCYCCLSELLIPHSKVWIVCSIQWGKHQKSIPSVPNPQTQTAF